MSAPPLTLADAARMMREALRDRSYRSTPLSLEVARYYRWKKNERGATADTLRDYEAILAKLALDHADLGLADFAPPVGTERLRELIDSRSDAAHTGEGDQRPPRLLCVGGQGARPAGEPSHPDLPAPKARRGPWNVRAIGRCPARLVAAAPPRSRRAPLALPPWPGESELARVQFKHYDGRQLTVFGKGGEVRYLPVVDAELRLQLERHILDRAPAPDEHLLYPEKLGHEF